MTNDVPTPPEREKIRQQTVHALRMQRIDLARKLKSSDFTDTLSVVELMNVNAKIEVLKSMREPTPDTNDEPSIKEIEARGLNWSWEEWRDEEDEEPEQLNDSEEWCKITGISVMDPDGWDRSNLTGSWLEKISYDEFMRRAMVSTLNHFPKKADTPYE